MKGNNKTHNSTERSTTNHTRGISKTMTPRPSPVLSPSLDLCQSRRKAIIILQSTPTAPSLPFRYPATFSVQRDAHSSTSTQSTLSRYSSPLLSSPFSALSYTPLVDPLRLFLYTHLRYYPSLPPSSFPTLCSSLSVSLLVMATSLFILVTHILVFVPVSVHARPCTS